jgi:hypothetical protein
MTAMTWSARLLLFLIVLVALVGCAGGGPGGSARSGCFDQSPGGSQSYDSRPVFFLFCRQTP